MSLYGGVRLPGCPDPLNSMRLTELASPMIRRMMNTGICLDREWLGDFSLTLQARKADLRKEITAYVPADRLDQFVSKSDEGTLINVESAEKMAELLYKELGIGLGRNLKRTKSGTRISTGKKQMETLKREHPVIPKILEYRECSKLDSTYCVGLPKLVQWDKYWGRWVLYTTLLTTRTDTDRLASKRPNLQNVPARTKLGQMIRKAFIARPGKLLVSRDFSQIELRLVASAAQDRVMLDIFRQGGDVHIATACRAFALDYSYYIGLSNQKDAGTLSKSDTEIWKSFSIEKRAPCKNVNFGVCVKKGQQLLTNRGLIPIENITPDMLLWDGIEWISHSGVIYKGIKHVITYDGITATPDHKVWVQDGRVLPLSQAMAERSPLAVGAVETSPIRHTGNYLQEAYPRKAPSGKGAMWEMWSNKVSGGAKSAKRVYSTLSMPIQIQVPRPHRAVQEATPTLRIDKTKMYQSEIGRLGKLRRKRNPEQVQILRRVRPVRAYLSTSPHLQGSRYWTYQEQRPLRTRKHTTRETWLQSTQYPPKHMGELQRQEDSCSGSTCTIDSRLSEFSSEPYTHAEFSSRGCVLEEYITANSTQALEKAEVYDILNAGPRHRFTCEGKLVSNCYGLGAPGLYDLMAVTYATAGLDLPNWVTLEWCEEFINIWFSIYPDAKAYFDLMAYRAQRYKISWGIFGGVRRIPEVRSCHDRVRAAGLRQAGNNPIQRDAAGVFKLGMARVEDLVMRPARESGMYAEALLPVHDELIMEVDEEFADVIGEAAGYQMEQSLVDVETGELHCRVPILTDGHSMPLDKTGMSRWEK